MYKNGTIYFVSHLCLCVSASVRSVVVLDPFVLFFRSFVCLFLLRVAPVMIINYLCFTHLYFFHYYFVFRYY
jgi:hypothetical protein